MSSLADREKQLLLEVARRALAQAVINPMSLSELREEVLPRNENLQAPGGAFVTLRRRKRLRGCIGQLPSKESLIQIVAFCAKAAALEDPRFDPVTPDELAEIEIEISVLSPLNEIAPDQIEAGKHGLAVSRGALRGVLLPQVAVQFRWSAQRFLEETCAKAGLERDAWKEPDTRIQAFTAETFAESDLQASNHENSQGSLGGNPGYSSST